MPAAMHVRRNIAGAPTGLRGLLVYLKQHGNAFKHGGKNRGWKLARLLRIALAPIETLQMVRKNHASNAATRRKRNLERITLRMTCYGAQHR